MSLNCHMSGPLKACLSYDGTHVDTTGEVGFVTLKREHPGKSIERIEIRLVDDIQ